MTMMSIKAMRIKDAMNMSQIIRQTLCPNQNEKGVFPSKTPLFLLFEVGDEFLHYLFDLVWVLAIDCVHHRSARIRESLAKAIIREGFGLFDEEAVVVYPSKDLAVFIDDIFAHHLAIGDATNLTEKVKDI